MWCCVGSGIENHTKYGELIYSHSANNIFVNLFIPSTLNWKEKNIQIEQNTSFPYKNESELVLKIAKSQTFVLNIRQPKWAENFEILVNGKVLQASKTGNYYVSVNRKWKSGDKIMVRFKTTMKLENLPDGSNWSAFMHGPIVLAAKTSTTDLVGLFADDSRMGHETKSPLYPMNKAHALVDEKGDFKSKIKSIGNLKFSLDSLTLQPFFEIHDARYQMYFQTFNKTGFENYQASIKQKEVEQLALEARTIDKVNCGEQQPEVDHSYKGEESNSGYDDEQFWRNTRSFISYQLQNKNKVGKCIEISVLDDFNADNLEISINGNIVEFLPVENKIIRIKDLENETINLKILAKNNALTPKFIQIKLLTN
jgi:uncharacterized protein